MKVAVDAELCQGHARCWDICPEVFGLDEEGHAVVLLEDVPPPLERGVRDAVVNCPERAIAAVD
jgi:ferredoxin